MTDAERIILIETEQRSKSNSNRIDGVENDIEKNSGRHRKKSDNPELSEYIQLAENLLDQTALHYLK